MSADSDPDLLTITLAEGAKRLRAGEVTSQKLTRAFLDRIAATDERVRAFVTVTEESAVAEAQQADNLLSSGDATAPLTGLPIGLKDVLL
ncbi:MAG: amidase family protein, partial [Chloroflexi bacterium]|nr:amidase family protein [Chloroflexota bacterium]